MFSETSGMPSIVLAYPPVDMESHPADGKPCPAQRIRSFVLELLKYTKQNILNTLEELSYITKSSFLFEQQTAQC